MKDNSKFDIVNYPASLSGFLISSGISQQYTCGYDVVYKSDLYRYARL